MIIFISAIFMQYVSKCVNRFKLYLVFFFIIFTRVNVTYAIASLN